MLAASGSPGTKHRDPEGELGPVQGGLTGRVCPTNNAHLLLGQWLGLRRPARRRTRLPRSRREGVRIIDNVDARAFLAL